MRTELNVFNLIKKCLPFRLISLLILGLWVFAGIGCEGDTSNSTQTAPDLSANAAVGSSSSSTLPPKSVSPPTTAGTSSSTATSSSWIVREVQPISGPPAGDTPLTLIGSGFTSTLAVALGSNSCTSVSLVNSTRLTCRTPASAVGTANLMVSGQGLTLTLPAAYEYVAAPTLTSVTPLGGPITGNTLLTLTGTGFRSGATVKLGSETCGFPTLLSTTSLRCISPSVSSAQAVTLNFRNSDGQASTTSLTYTYLASPTITAMSPTSTKKEGGTSITLTGTGFTSGSTLLLAGSSLSISTLSSTLTPTQLVFTTPAITITGNYRVSIYDTYGQSATSSQNLTVKGPPIVSTISPTVSKPTGGTTFQVIGSGLESSTQVALGSTVAVSCTVDGSGLMLTCISGNPSVAVTSDSAVALSLCNSDGQFTVTGNHFQYNAPLTLSSISPSAFGLSQDVGTTLTLVGTGFKSNLQVLLGSTACVDPAASSTQATLTCTLPSFSKIPTSLLSVSLLAEDGQTSGLSSTLSFSFAPSSVQTIVGSSATPATINSTVGISARFESPSGIAHFDNRLFVADTANHSIREITLSGNYATSTVLGSPTDTTILKSPGTLAYDAGNDVLYIADTLNYRIQKATTATTNPALAGFSDLTSIEATAKPVALAIYSSNVYAMVERSAGGIELYQIPIATGTPTKVAGQTTAGSTDGVGAAASITKATSMVSLSSKLYFTESTLHTLRSFDPSTALITLVAGISGSSGSTDGSSTTSQLNEPIGLATAGPSTLLISDRGNGVFRTYSTSTGAVGTLALGNKGYPGTVDGLGSSALLAPTQVIFNSSGTGAFYFTEAGSNTVRASSLTTLSVATRAGLASPLDLTLSAGGITGVSRTPGVKGITSCRDRLYFTESDRLRTTHLTTGLTSTLTLTASGSTVALTAASGVIIADCPSSSSTPVTLHVVEANTLKTVVINGLTGGVTLTTSPGMTCATTGCPLSSTGVTILIAGSTDKKVYQFNTTTAATVSTAVLNASAPTRGVAYGNSRFVTTLFDGVIHEFTDYAPDWSAGTSRTAAGTAGHSDAPVEFNTPHEVVTDGTYFFVADSLNGKIRKVTSSATAITYWGTPFGSDANDTELDTTPLSNATFYRPQVLHYNPEYGLFVGSRNGIRWIK